MSNSSNDLIATVYYNGRRYFGPNGQIFEGDTKVFRMSPHCTFDELKKIIYRKLRLQRPQRLARLSARCATGNPVQWIAVDVVEDDDVKLVIDAWRNHGQYAIIELYAEINDGGQSSTQHSIPSISTFDINMEPVVTQHSVLSTGTFDMNMEPVVNPEDMSLPSPPPPAPIYSEMSPVHYSYDPSRRSHSSDESTDEGNVPDSESSDTDVEGDFERNPPRPTCLPIPSPGIVGMQDPPPVPGDDNVPFWEQIGHYTNINWAHPDQELDDISGTQQPGWQMGQELYKGQVFESKQDVQMAIKQFCMANHYTVAVEKSDTKRLIMICQNHNDGCPWRMRAYVKKGDVEWVVGVWNNKHICVSQSLSQDHKQLDSNFICDMIIGIRHL